LNKWMESGLVVKSIFLKILAALLYSHWDIAIHLSNGYSNAHNTSLSRAGVPCGEWKKPTA
jgi:hypothetical protein